MLKVLKYLGVTLMFIFAILLLAPILFKSQIVDLIRKQINNNVAAQVDFGDVHLSLIRSFPDFSLTIEDFSVQGVDTFADVRLADIERFRFTLNLMSVIRGDEIEIKTIALTNPTFHIVVLDSLLVNYDIMLPSDEIEDLEQSEDEPGAFKMALRSLRVVNLKLTYDDRMDDMYMEIEGLNHQLSGNFSNDDVAVSAVTEIERLLFKMDGITFLSNVKALSEFSLDVHQPTMKVKINENSFARLNDLQLGAKGFVQMNEETMDMDLEFASKRSDFRQIVSLIPAYFMEDFAGLDVRGSCIVEGKISGTYDGVYEQYPSMDIRMKAKDGFIKYPDLPAALEKVAFDASIKHPGGDLDKLKLNVYQFTMTLAEQTFSASMALATPMSDPALQFAAKGKLRFDDLSKVVPLEEGMRIKGLLDVDMELAAQLSQIENEEFDKIVAKGRGELTNFEYLDADMPMPVKINYVAANLNPNMLQVENFKMEIGSSDFTSSGQIDNLLHYVLMDTTLVGRFSLNSNLIDIDELMKFVGEEEESASSATQEEVPLTSEDLKLPAAIDFLITAGVEKIIYDGLVIENASGKMHLADEAISLNAKMKMLDAAMSMDGTFETRSALPKADFRMGIENLAFQRAYEELDMIKAFAPIFGNTEGSFSTQFSMKTELLADATPNLQTFWAEGVLNTTRLDMESEVSSKVASFLRNDDYKKLILQATRADFKIENGRLYLDETPLNGKNYTGSVQGSSGLDQSLDFSMNLEIPVTNVKAANLLSSIGVEGVNKVPLKVGIGGTFSSPKISTNLGDLGRSVVDDLRDRARERVQDEIDKVRQDVTQRATEELQKILDEARKQADEIIRQAEIQAQNIRKAGKEAADNIRAEARRQVDRQMAEAGNNPLQRRLAREAGDRIIAEADRKATRAENEANTRANQLEQEAKNRANKIIKDAEDKVNSAE